MNTLFLKQVYWVSWVFGIFFILGFWANSAQARIQKIPNSIILLPENQNVILVEKKTQTLKVYTNAKGILKAVFDVPCSTGEIKGEKQKAGDKKTPEGVYFLTDEYEDRYLTPVYGKKAFPTDYPNFIDRIAGKNGTAIWIHGTNKELKPMDSNGCIALENENIVKLSDYITVDSTAVVIVEEIQYTSDQAQTDQLAEELMLFIRKWQHALNSSSYHEYLALYSDKYLPEISWWPDWLKLRTDAANSGMDLVVRVADTGTYFHDNVFVALFDLSVSIGGEQYPVGKRKIFIAGNSNTGYEIVGDLFQTRSKDITKDGYPIVAAAKSFIIPGWEEKRLVSEVQRWLAAWSKMDMKAYADFYAENFVSDGMNKQQWVNRKRSLSKKYNFINVTGKDFKVKIGNERSEVEFFQEYKSSGLSTDGTKRLRLVKKGGSWKIYQESWKKK